MPDSWAFAGSGRCTKAGPCLGSHPVCDWAGTMSPSCTPGTSWAGRLCLSTMSVTPYRLLHPKIRKSGPTCPFLLCPLGIFYHPSYLWKKYSHESNLGDLLKLITAECTPETSLKRLSWLLYRRASLSGRRLEEAHWSLLFPILTCFLNVHGKSPLQNVEDLRMTARTLPLFLRCQGWWPKLLRVLLSNCRMMEGLFKTSKRKRKTHF